MQQAKTQNIWFYVVFVDRYNNQVILVPAKGGERLRRKTDP